MLRGESMENKIYASLMGTALGDSIGLPFEGLSRAKIANKNPSFETQSLFLSKGMFSDDTEQSVAVVQSLIESYDDERLFQKNMTRRLQFWFLALPAGVGFATMRAISRSFFLKNPAVFSAGNAPAMRSGILGIVFGHDNVKLQKMVFINTNLTHSDPKAYYGALAVAKASYLSSIGKEEDFFEEMERLIIDEAFQKLLKNVKDSLDLSTLEFAKQLDLEKAVGGYIYYTLPMVLHVWLKHKNNLREALIEIIKCGGDTDTTGAILGSIIGVRDKKSVQKWIDTIMDYPLSPAYIQKISYTLSEVIESKKVQKAPHFFFLTTILRNMVFLSIVLIVSLTRWF